MYHDEDDTLNFSDDDFELDPFDMGITGEDDLDDMDEFGMPKGKKGVDPDSISEDDML